MAVDVGNNDIVSCEVRSEEGSQASVVNDHKYNKRSSFVIDDTVFFTAGR